MLRRFLPGLILALLLVLGSPSPSLAGWGSPPPDEPGETKAEALERERKERAGMYFVMLIAALIGTVVVYQFTREVKTTVPVKARKTDSVWDD